MRPERRAEWGAESAHVAPVLLLALLGCDRRSASSAGGAILSRSAADLAPASVPRKRATLRLGTGPGATEFEVGLRPWGEGTSRGLDLTSEGEIIEREGYESAGSAFRVVTAGVDAFAPGIDLLRYPVRQGAEWEWEGKVAYAGVSRDARATVTTVQDGAEIRSDVRLFVSADPGRPDLERRLAFWFLKGHGVVRRSFGDVSSRRPVGEAWRP